MATLIRRISERDGHVLKRPTKTSLFKFLHDNQIANTPRISTCPYRVSQEEACEDDVCQQCRFRKVMGKDIICTWESKNQETI